MKKTLILKILSTVNSNPERQNMIIKPFEVEDFFIKILPDIGVSLSYKLNENASNFETQDFSMSYFGNTTYVLFSISLNNEILYINPNYKDCREEYYAQTIKNKKLICSNGVELDSNGKDCDFYDDGTNWEKLAGFDEEINNQNKLASNNTDNAKNMKIKQINDKNGNDNLPITVKV